MTTIIRSNGSTFAGDPFATIDQLIEIMGREPLSPTFEEYGDFVDKASASFVTALEAGLDPNRTWHVWGNFHNLSHVFSIMTDDQDVVDRLITAVKANKATVAYKVARDERRAYVQMRKDEADKRERLLLESQRAAARTILRRR